MATYTTVITALAALLGTAHGHMIMNTPTPFNYHGTSKLVQVNPLGAAFPFPCQGLSDPVSVTPITAGGTQLVNFTGGAQHGGGSCQFSITYEHPPPADKSKWKTIYTLIGGCPVSAQGNLPAASPDQDGRADSPHCGNDSGTECVRQFQIPIPKQLPSGNATFAWTWFNKIGNREVYMNCAPVSIQGGVGDQAFFDALPPMFLANVPGECTTGNGVLNIPNLGKYGRVLEQPAADGNGNCPKADGIPKFDGDSGSGSGSASGSTSSSSAVVAPSSTPATTTTTAPPAATTSAPSTFVTQTTTAAAGITSIVVVPPPSATPGTVNGAQPCSPNGALLCFSPTTFGLCANGMAIPQPVAAGTTCSNGVIVRRSARFVLE